MNPHCISSFINGFKPNRAILNLDRYPVSDPVIGIRTSDPFMNFGFMDNPSLPPDTNYAGNPSSLSTISTDEDSPLDDGDFSDSILRYINQMLMEEDMEERPSMFHDSLALQAAEESFYEVIGEKYPSSSIQNHLHNDHHGESPEDSLSGNTSEHSSSGSYGNGPSTSNSVESQWSNVDLIEYKPSLLQPTFPANFAFQSRAQFSLNNMSSFSNNHNGFMGTSMTDFLDSKLLSKGESVLQFERGVEEAIKFLPKDNPLIIDLATNANSPSLGKARQVVIKTEKDEREHVPPESKVRKNREDETDLEDGRRYKQSAVYVDDSELSELFDKVLLGTGWGKEPPPMCICSENCHNESHMSVQQNEESNKSGERKRHVRKQSYDEEVVDLTTLLIQCAQAVSSGDRATANELLKQIRQHSSSLGSGSHRLAYCFANALEARLAGTGTQIYTALSSKRTSATDMIKAHQMYISACSFMKIAIIYANHTILHLVNKVETLHIIDFGIRYGFQWPALIYRLSKRSGGPPKLRITGIELPQPGFRPAERVLETGSRLARYCERFNVPFEYNAIAQKWETIKIEDLKIKKNELVAVNCRFRFQNLLDETVVLSSPKDAVLKLIRKAKPNIFLHAIVNGFYNAPFFVTRFREALFHYSSMFDMLDTNVARDDPLRLMLEKEFFGREVMNIIACEGSERVERPETYKQWHVRKLRAGFRPLPLDHHVIDKLRGKLREVYHSDFMLDEEGNWMLQGWKGRIVFASSCWVPA